MIYAAMKEANYEIQSYKIPSKEENINAYLSDHFQWDADESILKHLVKLKFNETNASIGTCIGAIVS